MYNPIMRIVKKKLARNVLKFRLMGNREPIWRPRSHISGGVLPHITRDSIQGL